MEPIKAEHLVITNCCSSVIEHCSWTFANPGDAFLLGRSFYGAFPADVSLRTGTDLIPVSFGSIDPMSLEAVAEYEEAITNASRKGQRVKGLILCSPHNPLGRCYAREVLVAYMRLCQKYQVHLMSDEIYAFSVWENEKDSEPRPVEFTSILSIGYAGLIDPSLLTVLWGMSKDFGANGLRVGCLISQHNEALMLSLESTSIYSYVSSISDHITASLLEDDKFTHEYILTNQARLADSYSFVVNALRENKIDYAPGATAGFFIWANLGNAYRPKPSAINEDRQSWH